MIEVVKEGGKLGRRFIEQLKARSASNGKKVDAAVAEILQTVKTQGDKAVLDYTMRFDGAVPNPIEVTHEQMEKLKKSCDPDFLKALHDAAENIKDFHQRQKQQSWIEPKKNGVLMGQRIRGLKRVGIYVPGGTAAYPSSVLMNAIPAHIAGVEEIIVGRRYSEVPSD